MSMHLHHASLSLNGKSKAKKKFRNAEEARRARELEDSWEKLQKKWDVKPAAKKATRTTSKDSNWSYNLSVPTDRNTKHIPSLNSGAGVATKAEPKQYTGTKVIGVTVLHKSCLQPVFNEQAAKDAASMRR
jgi:phosphopantetheinyl transferase (holo-ACP synthase)